MANTDGSLPVELKRRIFNTKSYNFKERQEIYNKYVERVLKLNCEDPENFSKIVVHLDKVLDRQILKPNRGGVKKKLTYSKRRELGLYTLGRKSLIYKEILPLHKLWKEYMTKFLNLDDLRKQNWTNNHEDPNFEQVSLKLYRADYHGSKIIVVRSVCASLVGRSGIVVMETKNCFKLLGNDNVIRTLPKVSCVFKFRLEEFEFMFFGKNFRIRPAERSSKKVKTIFVSDL